MKYIYSSILIATLLIVGAMIFSAPGKSKAGDEPLKNNVTIENGIQIVELRAKGGYTPKKSSAKAGISTTLRVDTNGTFDCSSVIRIPSMNISQNLPQSGVTDIDLGTQTAGTLYGTCGMGMYPFEINFN